MKRRPLQVFVDEDDLRRLEEWTECRGWTKSQALRAAIRALTRPRAEQDSLLAASGMIDELPADLSERMDRYLEDTFIAEKAAARYRGRHR